MTVMILSHITATEEKSVFFSVHIKKILGTRFRVLYEYKVWIKDKVTSLFMFQEGYGFSKQTIWFLQNEIQLLSKLFNV